MKTFKQQIKRLATISMAIGGLCLASISAHGQNLFVDSIRLDWDPGASTPIDEETQVVSFRPGDPITYSVTYGRSNTSNPPQGRQPFIVKRSEERRVGKERIM